MPLGVLIGPQRLTPTIDKELLRWGIPGPLATITAGWQEREAEDDELKQFLGLRCINLRLHSRSDDVYQHDPELFDAHREKQDTFRHMQALYRMRLGHAIGAARKVARYSAPPSMVAEEYRLALEGIRTLDAQHMARATEVQKQFELRLRPAVRPAVERHYRELRTILGQCFALLIAGGHVASLLSRMRLFQLDTLLNAQPRPLPIFAWSAGAMAMTDRIILFHDSPPQGPGNAEVMGPGLGLVPNLIVLPHARRRLRLDDPGRVALFASRFAPTPCVTLDEQERLVWDGQAWSADPGVQQLMASGELGPMQTHASATETS